MASAIRNHIIKTEDELLFLSFGLSEKFGYLNLILQTPLD